jgi:hypothetical protein
MLNNKNKNDELAPCGIFCGACPSFNKSCKGCGSEDKEQKRLSKFNCQIRVCCYTDMQLDFCIDCEQFPCKIIDKKLINSHPGDTRYTYRHEIPEILIKLKTMSLDNYVEFQTQRWKCKSCGGTIQFYIYNCNKCGNKQLIR